MKNDRKLIRVIMRLADGIETAVNEADSEGVEISSLTLLGLDATGLIYELADEIYGELGARPTPWGGGIFRF